MNAISGLTNPIQWLVDAINGTGNSKPVSANDAISTAPMWYGVGKIAGDVGMLPLNVHRQTESGSEKDKAHYGSKLMRSRPNAYQIPAVFKEQIQTHALLWGNGRAYVVRDDMGNPIELIPLMPDRTDTVLHEGMKYHITRPRCNDRLLVFDRNAIPEDIVVMEDREVLHIPGLGFDGFNGKSLLRVARESLNVGIQGDRRAANQMQSGFSGQVMLEAPQGVFRNEMDAKEFLEHFRESHSADKDGKPIGLLREGMKAQVMNMSNRDAEFLQSRKFQREEVALWLGIETMPGIGNDSYNSLEQRNLAYLMGLQRWLTKWEQECDAKLLSESERENSTHYFKFNVAALKRTDLETTINSFGNAISSRIMNPNEAREKLDMNSYEGGDLFENPYTTSGAASPTGTEEDTADDETQNLNTSAIVAHLEHLLGVEEKRVNEMLSKGENEKVFKWYTKWETKLANNIEKLGGDRNLATEHCRASLTYVEKHNQLNLLGSAELLAKEIEEYETL
jgi:HK97 family phage portal protein